MDLYIRPCKATDTDLAIPLMLQSGPEAFRYVFSVDSRDQAIEFLHYAFRKGGGEFGFQDHYMILAQDRPIGIFGLRHAALNTTFTFDAINKIKNFYGLRRGIKVLYRGLQVERVIKPPRPKALCLHNFAIAEHLRGQGVGTFAINYVFQLAKQRGYQNVSLDVAETNLEAKKLYQKMGFVERNFTAGGAKNKFGKILGHSYMEVNISA